MEERTLVVLAIAVLVANAGFFIFTLTPNGESLAASHTQRGQNFEAGCDAWQQRDNDACSRSAANATAQHGNATFVALGA